MSTKAQEISLEDFSAFPEQSVEKLTGKKRKRVAERAVKEKGPGEKPANDDCSGKKSKGWFLTFPQCPAPKEKILELLKAKLSNYKIVEHVICNEKHKDGEPHSHAFIKLDRPVRFMKDRFDFEYEGKNYHGNYQVAKSWIAVKEYVMKDGDYISSIDIDSAMKKKGKMKKEDLLRPIDEVLDEEIISPMQVAAFYKNQCAYKMLSFNRKSIPEVMPPKQRHRWIYGPSNTGKTERKLKWIRQHGEDNCFQIPYNGDWVGYNNQKYLYADEYKGQLSIQELNRICDGGAKMNVKGATVQLEWDVEVLICSNYDVKDCYSKADKVVVQSVYNRFILEELFWDPDYAKKMNELPAQNKDKDKDLLDELGL